MGREQPFYDISATGNTRDILDAGCRELMRRDALLPFALDYGRMGWHIFPCWWIEEDHCACGARDCGSPSKHPLGQLAPRGFRDASTDEKMIRRWWTAAPLANIAIATGSVSGIVVLDVDPRHGGNESFAKLEAEIGRMPRTCEVITPSGGRHIYFRHPGAGIKVRCVVGFLPGLDVRADGGYVIGPPSRGLGGLYESVD